MTSSFTETLFLLALGLHIGVVQSSRGLVLGTAQRTQPAAAEGRG